MVTMKLFTLAMLLVSSIAAPSPRPQAEVNIANTNTSSNTPESSTEAAVNDAAGETSVLGGTSASEFRYPGWIPIGQGLKPKLSQEQTNGRSKLGTFDAPRLPHFLDGGPVSAGFPWGGRTCKNTNYYHDTPNTGVTKHYDFTVSLMTIAPDGVEKEGLVVNGQYPGPTIEANWGDWIEVTVHNQLDEGTSLHWHGLLQNETPWFDGVPGVQQCPIAPGASFTYRFRADLYGTTWWHSHYSAQMAGGAFGSLIIYGPSDNIHYDEDLGPVLINDWFHEDYFSLVEQVMAPAAEKRPPPLSNNNLINGKMNYPCANATAGYKCTPNAGVSKFHFESGKTYRLRLINAGAEGLQKFSIDGHRLTVFANDFVPIVPYDTDVVTLGVGQRADVVVEAIGKPTDAVWMRATLGPTFAEGGCSLIDGVSPTAVAAIYYEKSNSTAVPTTKTDVSLDSIKACHNDALTQTVPYYPIPLQRPTTVQNIDITFQSNGTHNLFYMNNSTFRANYNDPVLLDAKLGNNEYPAEYNVFNFGSSKVIRLVLYNHAQTGSHPMHLHGHNAFILAEGFGKWDGSITNAHNPQRRDVHLLQNAASATEPSYLVIQIDADNPGVWPFHCHIAWHVSGGLYINILERPDDIKKDMEIPGIMAQTCRDWSAYTGRDVVEQIDSGLKVRGADWESW
ncbi:Putative multicopper oxidase, type 1, multicopper oxidase, copper-binding, cupredoxin [Septoria linicola]|uniref:Multicopper oxidase, type 1, multicopper oxidase, copper-binding, cupredoxin n=1 Tax=Septoria linicola TaxID=215465 RepID=A0A9Q9EH84_9PEZI|nr:Putative multicopper oxidase, type 1, multicopper oxidase, copper-binding, cupredoxin [Septoria linicola]